MSGAILAIETSCDDSCAAVVDASGLILSNVIASQSIHDKYGGVVPEIAARHHLHLLTPTIDAALSDAGLTLDLIERVAVTQGPGLIGALLVGVAQAKAIAAARGVPLVAVDHLQGHVAANFLGPDPFEPPFVCLIASGGHTLLARVEEQSSYTVLGETLDDAAGEAFDKGARMLGLLGSVAGQVERSFERATSRSTMMPTWSTSRAWRMTDQGMPSSADQPVGVRCAAADQDASQAVSRSPSPPTSPSTWIPRGVTRNKYARCPSPAGSTAMAIESSCPRPSRRPSPARTRSGSGSVTSNDT